MAVGFAELVQVEQIVEQHGRGIAEPVRIAAGIAEREIVAQAHTAEPEPVEREHIAAPVEQIVVGCKPVAVGQIVAVGRERTRERTKHTTPELIGSFSR